MLVAPEGRERFAMAIRAVCSGASSKGKCIQKELDDTGLEISDPLTIGGWH
jgi:hypothetical protein